MRMVRIASLPGSQVGEEMEVLIRKAAEKALLMESSEGCEVSIFLTDDTEIHRLNKLYRDIDRPTDVLAFAMREGVDGDLNQEILGDVVISLPRIEHQASVYGHSFEVEMLFLVSHGVLHLLGYEHDKEDDMLVMQRKQKDILHSLGYDLAEFGDMAVRIAESKNGDERQVIRA
jgi:probable rRNA maturation factor